MHALPGRSCCRATALRFLIVCISAHPSPALLTAELQYNASLRGSTLTKLSAASLFNSFLFPAALWFGSDALEQWQPAMGPWLRE